MKVVDVADEIYRELGSPTDTSVASISFWVRSNIGALNNHTNMEFTIDGSTLEVSYLDDDDEKVNLGIEDAAILKKMNLPNKTLFIISEKNQNFQLAVRNLPYTNVLLVDGLNVFDLLKHERIVCTKDALQKIEERLN